MNFIIYHSKDLDGKASGAIGALYFQKDNPKLVPYHYDEPIDMEQFKDKDVLMVDVTLSLDKIIELATTAKSFTLVDHHVSFFDKLMDLLNNGETDPNLEIEELDFTGLIKNFNLSGSLNLAYYYSEKLSACEMMLQLYRVGNEYTEKNIKVLGQYDTWRNTDEKKFSTDINWSVVMDHQYGFRLAETITEVQNFLMFADYVHIGNGFNILKYQSAQNKLAMNRSFQFKLNGLRILACEGVQFNSNSFESAYNPEFHDAMMPFNYDGQQKIWNFSLYTTKPEVDILSIAKQYGGGGHKQACGFQLPFNEVTFNKEGELQFGTPIFICDIADLPKDFDIEKLKNLLKQVSGPIFLEKVPSSPVEKIVMERDTYQPPTDETKVPPPPVQDNIVTDKIPGLSDTDDLANIGNAEQKQEKQEKPKDIASVKPSNTKSKSNGAKPKK